MKEQELDPNGVINIVRKISLRDWVTLALILFLFWSLIGNVFDHKIAHAYPVGYLAGDGFMHLAYSDALYREKNVKSYPTIFTMTPGDALYFQPVILYHFNAVMKEATGLDMYDINYLNSGILLVLLAAIFFLILFKFDKNVALLSLPLLFFLPTFPFHKLLSWGWHIAISGFAFMVLCFYIIFHRSSIRFSTILFFFVLALTVLSHIDGMLYAFFVIFCTFLVFILTQKHKPVRIVKEFFLREWKGISIGLLIFLLCSAYYLFIFKLTWLSTDGSFISFKPEIVDWDADLIHLKFALPFIIIGFICALVFTKEGNLFTTLFLSLFLLTFVHYMGYSRIIRFNFLMPLWLSPLFGLGIWCILQFVKQQRFVKIIAVFLSLLFFFAIYQPVPPLISITNWPEWEGVKWIQNNANGTVLYLYHNLFFNQYHATFSSQHLHRRLDISAISNSTTISTLPVVSHCDIRANLPGWSHGKIIGLFVPKTPPCQKTEERSVCEFDYVVVEGSQQQELNDFLQKNILAMQEKKTHSQVFNNGFAYILKRNTPCGT